MKKKFLLVSLAAIGAFAFAFALAGCNNEQGETACKHEQKQHTPASNSNCITHGTEEYWYCPDCTTYFTDEGGTTKTTLEAVTKPLGAHSYNAWVDEDPATCSETGTKGHQYCSVCQKNYDQSNVEIADLTIAIDPAAHTYTEQDWVEETPATCSAKGTKGHYHCDACNKDVAKNGEVIADLEIDIDPTAHNYGELIPAKEAGDCLHPGNEAHYHCDLCGTDFHDDADKTEYNSFPPFFESPTIAGAHSMTHYAAHTAENCLDTEYTHPENWYCSICETRYRDEAGTNSFEGFFGNEYMETQGPHNIYKEDGKTLDETKISATVDGTTYYHCDLCGKDVDEYGNEKDDSGEVDIPDDILAAPTYAAGKEDGGEAQSTCGE